MQVLESVPPGFDPSYLPGILAGLAAFVAGLGGVAALLRVRVDKKVGVAQQEVAEDDAITERWKSIIQVQTESLLKPMQEEITKHAGKIAELETKLERSQQKYWGAVSYIRNLLMWINRHLPADSVDETTQIPGPPAIIVEDI